MVAERQKTPKVAAQQFETVPCWDGHSSSLDAYEERVKLYITSTKKNIRYLLWPSSLVTIEPDSDAFRIVREKLSGEQLEAEDGSGGRAIATALRTQLGPKSLQ